MIGAVAVAPVAELVDALDSKSSSGNGVGVRVSLGAPFSLHRLRALGRYDAVEEPAPVIGQPVVPGALA